MFVIIIITIIIITNNNSNNNNKLTFRLDKSQKANYRIRSGIRKME